MGIAADIIFIVLAGLIGGLVAQRLGQPLLVGYILGGILVGPHAAGAIVDLHNIELLAEIGVALLLFAVGLEVSFADLRPVRRIALIGGPIQILITLIFGYGVARGFLGWEAQHAIWFGAMISLSSTMVVLKILMAEGTMSTSASRVMIGLLVVQDLAVAPMLIVLPRLQDWRHAVPDLITGVLQASLFLAGMILVGTRLAPRLLKTIARWNSRELFLVAVIALGVGVGYGTYLFGLSFAFGAFVAGMVLSESEFSHQALSEIVPLRDVFGLLFFASVGMLLDPRYVVENAAMVILIVSVVIIGKAAIFGCLTRGFGYLGSVPWIVALGLPQVGEFSFVLARTGLQAGALSDDVYTLTLTTTLATMIVSPLLARTAAPLFRVWRQLVPVEPAQLFNVPAQAAEGHIIVAGYGRTGRTAVQVMRNVNVAFVVIELDHRIAEDLAGDGVSVIWGSSSHEAVLEAAGVRGARLLLITVPDAVTVRLTVERARAVNPDLHVVARALYREHLTELRDLGVDEAVQPEFEAGLEMVRQVLTECAIPPTDIYRFSDAVRADLYGPLRDAEISNPLRRLLSDMRRVHDALEIEWVAVPPETTVAGSTLGDLDVRSRTGASVVAALRPNEITPNPGAEYLVSSGDTLALLGTTEQRTEARRLIEARPPK